MTTGNTAKNDITNDLIKSKALSKEGRENWAPEIGILLSILSETQSVTGKTYCMVEEVEPNGSEPRIGVINKEAIEIDSDDLKAIWKTARNPVKIGRFARAFLTAAKVTFTDQDIEVFVNEYKATYDFAADILKQFDIVQGNDIIHWYWHDQYQSGGGSLNNSCMAHADSEWLEIYSKNSEVSLVILYDDNGTIEDGKYVSTKIKGRAVLWDCKVNGNDTQFLDRIYTSQDSDVGIFKQFAEKNGWWYKKEQSMSPDEKLTDGSQDLRDATLTCKVTSANPSGYYPYMDTFIFLDMDNNIATNKREDILNGRIIQDTNGSFDYSFHYGKGGYICVDGSVHSGKIRRSDNKLLIGGGKTLFETGSQTIWGNLDHIILLPQ